MAKLGIVADDLSGACDAGAEFASRNLSCVVDVAGTLNEIDEVDVLSISTETRSVSPAEAAIKIVGLFDRMTKAGLQFMYKKIDSTLRGNCRVEIDALLSAGRFKRAFIVPAFPEANRRVSSGSLYVNNGPSPALHIPSVLGEEHLQCVAVGECTDQLSLETGLFVIDAATRNELKHVAQFVWKRLPGTLLVGSAGLAGEIAELMSSGCADPPRAPRRRPFSLVREPIVFVVGSTHAQTAAQVDFLKQHREVEFIDLKPGWDIAARQTLLDGKNTAVFLSCDCIDFAELSKFGKLIRERLIFAFVATGGYTARLLCEALQARAIRLYSSLLPGTAMGSFIGGQAHALFIVTKSGGFGGADALARIEGFLRDEKAA